MAKSTAGPAQVRFKQLCCLGVGGEAVMPALVKELHNIVPSHGVTFFFADESMKLVNAYNDYSNPFYDKLYFDHFHGRRGLELAGTFPNAIRTEFGVRDTEELAAYAGIEVKALYRSEMWNVVQRPQRLHTLLRLFVHQEGRGRGLGSLTLHRSEGDPPWTRQEKQDLVDLEPFLAHALGGRSLDSDIPLADSGETGLIIADENGRPLHFSAEGQRLLHFASYDRIGPKADFRRLNTLPLPLVGICRDLSRLFAEDSTPSPPTYRVRNVWGGFTFRAHWLRSETGAGLIGITVSRQEPRSVKLLRGIGALPFSRRQAQVCLMMAQDRDYETIGRELRISKHTAIAHARWIYSKLDVHSRAELVSKLLSN